MEVFLAHPSGPCGCALTPQLSATLATVTSLLPTLPRPASTIRDREATDVTRDTMRSSPPVKLAGMGRRASVWICVLP